MKSVSKGKARSSSKSPPKSRTQPKKRSKKSQIAKRLTLRDRLGHLTVRAAERILGEDGQKRLMDARRWEIEVPKQMSIVGDRLTATVVDSQVNNGAAQVTIIEATSRAGGLKLNCDPCGTNCDHIAGVLHTLLESKLLLGLSTIPDPNEPFENLTEKELIQRAIAERRQRANVEKMTLKSMDSSTPWTDYTVTSLESGKSYRIAMRGTDFGQSYCTCPDFRTNQLGICKHILFVASKLERRFSKSALSQPYERTQLSLRMHYGDEQSRTLGLRFNLPQSLSSETARALRKVTDKTITDASEAVKLLRQLHRLGEEVTIYPDAQSFIDEQSLQATMKSKCEEIRKNPKRHPLRQSLLKTELLPYQLDGIAFAVGAGRAVLADDMGLGKTIQGIGVAQLLSRFTEIKNVLVVCPASLKSQWMSEIGRFSNRDAKIVLGNSKERERQYAGPEFFKIANYEQVVRDEAVVTPIEWDLIILDEGQRIKNWESKTSRTFQQLKSRFALILSGTPLENRLDELFTVVQFVDSHRLGPAYRFFHRHRIVNEDGRVIGYKNLDQLRELLKPILLRRTRESVMQQLPPRTTEVIRIRPTEEQKKICDGQLQIASMIAAKSYLTEFDLLKLQKCLLLARMSCDSTFLVNRVKPGFSSKLDVLDELLAQMADESSRKIIVFSEWTTMLSLIEPILKKHGIRFVRLDGSVEQKRRQKLVQEFQTDPTCRAIIMSNAGSTGLNLQSANTVINVDLPWNPAVLEQRVARAHRMGQKNPVQVFLLVTEDTIEEKMLETLALKHDLAMAALDVESNVSEVELESGMEQLKKRLEKLLGTKPNAPIDDSLRRDVTEQTLLVQQRREKVAAASGELLGAALQLVAQLIDSENTASSQEVGRVTEGLKECVERDEHGRPQLKLTLPNDDALNSLAQSLAKLLVVQK